MPYGKRIYLRREMPDPALVKAFEELPAANVADVMNRSSAMDSRIRLISAPRKKCVCGPALTVKCRAGDNLTLHAAMDLAEEGDFLVVSNEGDDSRSLMGAIMTAYLSLQKKAAGIVLDGPVRDVDALSQWDFPVYATGSTPGGPYKEGPGEINVPVSIGGISVLPGDLILADPDGIVVIPRKEAAEILNAARASHVKDEQSLQDALQGTAERSWVSEKITEKEYEIIDGCWRP